MTPRAIEALWQRHALAERRWERRFDSLAFWITRSGHIAKDKLGTLFTPEDFGLGQAAAAKPAQPKAVMMAEQTPAEMRAALDTFRTAFARGRKAPNG